MAALLAQLADAGGPPAESAAAALAAIERAIEGAAAGREVEQALEAVPSPVFYKDLAGVYRGCNKAFCDFLGRPKDQILGRTVHETSPKAAADKYKEMDEDLFRSPRTQVYEFTVTRNDGTQRDVVFHKAPLYDHDGRLTGLVGVIEDVTERKAMEDAVRRSEEKYRELCEAGSDILFHFDAEGVIRHIGPQITRYGYRPEEVVGRPFVDFVVDEDRARAVADFELTMTTGQEATTEVRVRDKQGRVHWLEDRGRPLRDAGGRIVGVAGVLRDTTARVRAEEALRESEDRYRRLVELSPDAIGVVGENEILFANAAAARLLGADCAEDLAGRSLWPLIAPDQEELVAGLLRRLLEDREPTPLTELRLRRLDGRMVPAEATGAPITFRNRRAAVVIVRDITERKQTELRFQEYQNQLRSLASQVSMSEERERRRVAEALHDGIGQSLALARIKLAQHKSGGRKSAPGADLAEVEELIKQSLECVRSQIYELSSPVLYELGLEAAIETLARKMQAQHGIRITVRDDGELKPLNPDVQLALYRGARELLLNVVKHSAARNATVSIAREGSRILVAVEDDGVGFGAGWQGAPDRGGGFGLMSLRERLRFLGGSFEARPAPGHGARCEMRAALNLMGPENSSGGRKAERE
ncbi:MAG TPA: PAS domain S-box protein [Candidatus Brocadiia bacterium]|nr:PAS domain S-box protein [Candidatus Brocadiia bacterium]